MDVISAQDHDRLTSVSLGKQRPRKFSGSKKILAVSIPIAAPLKEILESLPPHEQDTLCVNSRGESWTGDGFRTSLSKLLKSLERAGSIDPGLTFHGLRHTVATELRELGFDSRTIADMLGQKTTAMAEHYSKGADLERKLRTVVSALEKEESSPGKVSRKKMESV